MAIDRDVRWLAVTAVVAVGVPICAAAWVGVRTAALADALATAGGVPARIGTVDASLTGSIRLTDVGFGDLVAADAIEASVGMSSLLDGRMRADEIVVENPRVAIRIDGDGDSDLARLARRFAVARAAATSSGGGAVRRVVVAGGALTADIAGVGSLTARGVELVPDRTGVRVVTGPVRVTSSPSSDRRLDLDIAFERSAAELGFPEIRFGRVLAVAGRGSIAASSGPRIELHGLAAGRRARGGPLEVRGSIDDAGVARAIAVDVAPSDLAVTLRGEHVPLRALSGFASGLDLADTRTSGVVTVVRAAQGMRLSIDARLDELAIDHPRFAPNRVSLDLGVRAEVELSADAIAVTKATLSLGAIQLGANGWLRRGTPGSGRLDLRLSAASCGELLASLPGSLRGPLDGMVLDGRFGGRAQLAVDLAAPSGQGVTIASAFEGDCRVAAEPPAADVTSLLRAGDQQLGDGSRVRIGPGMPHWIAMRGLPAYVSGAFVSAEDGRFFDHPGFDLVQIARSLEIDLREHRLARGGSTITQQLAKNAFLSQRRSFDRKLQEAILTWRIEARLDKKQILERYLNAIELGPRIWGLEPAARYWFDVSPNELSIKQAAFLAAMTSQPNSMSRRVRRTGGLDAESAERVAVVLYAMRRDGAIDDPAYQAARLRTLRFAVTAIGRLDR